MTAAVIDVHAHALATNVLKLVSGHPGYEFEMEQQSRHLGAESSAVNASLFTGGWLLPLTHLDTRLQQMRDTGVNRQVVSLSPTQYHYWAQEDLARDIVAAGNQYLADLISRAPDRLAAFGTVALQYPELAAAQLTYAVSTLGFAGIQIGTFAAARDFSCRDYEPLWEAAEATGATVFIHPWGCVFGERLSQFYLLNIIGQPLETTTALCHLIFGGVFDRHPRLKILAAHGGGYLPQYLGRADHAFAVRPESRAMMRPPSEYVTSIYFDSLVYRSDTLRQLINVASCNNVMLGTDYPFDMSVEDPLTRLDSAPDLLADEVAAIRGGNAARVMTLPVW